MEKYTIKNLRASLQKQFDKMSATGKLFQSSVSGIQVWDTYINGFVNDPIFRDPNSSLHNCNHCSNFIHRYGNIVAIDENYNTISIWDNIEENTEFSNSGKLISQLLAAAPIKNVFFETYNDLNSLPYETCSHTNKVFKLGFEKNVKRYTKEEADKYGVVNANDVVSFNHISLNLPTLFVDKSGKSVESVIAPFKDAKNVFLRAMETIPLSTLLLVKDLIVQGSLLDGTAHLFKIEAMLPLKRTFDELSTQNKDNWAWANSYNFQLAKFRNELIGKLCSDLAEGVELNEACKAWNKRVDPANYMKATAPITKKQIEEAKKFIEENGYAESFTRRIATIDDINASEILHLNVAQKTIKQLSVFDKVAPTANSSSDVKKIFDGIKEVTIEKFMTEILPTCTGVEALFLNKHSGNLVTLTTSTTTNTKPIFKWDNNYSWTFNGNLAGKSMIKEKVKDAGGVVDAILRASLIWNESGSDNSDLDLWCVQPNGERIGFSTNFRKDRGGYFSVCGGQLDLDNTGPGSKIGIENIYFKDYKKLTNGKYLFFVNQYASRGSKGFKFEIEADGETYTYEYNNPVHGNINIAEVTIVNGAFNIKHFLPETAVASKEIYGIKTNEFHKVNLICLTPNHWGSNNIGNKHYLFMLDNCKTPTSIRGFHNENLIPELNTHSKVMEVLANSTMIEPSNTTKDELSGLGFNSTVHDELTVKLTGTHNRLLKIKF